jgi:hypothetical protein
MEIVKSSFSDIEMLAEFPGLLDEYGLESAIHGLPHPRAKSDSYRKLDKSGIFHVFCAFHEGKLVGFITVLLPVLNHYSETVAITESFFVGKDHRNTGAAIALKKKAEEFSKENMAFGILISAPSGSTLEKILPHWGYMETNKIFFKSFQHE